jgi:cyclopropane fatty-acyl-phospholipid synthase-like methyltransferase
MDVDWGCNYIVRHAAFLDSKYILEIGGGGFERVIALAERYPDKCFFSVDFFYSKRAIENVKNYAHLSNLNIIKGDAVNRIFADDTFDFVFSIDVGEHIQKLASFISEINRILKRGGHYFFIQNPFWTSNKGHHYKHWQSEVQGILKGYKHLLFTEQEMLSYFKQFSKLPCEPAEALQRIYHRNDLSRMSVNQTKEIFKSSELVIDSWENLLDDDYDRNLALKVIDKYPGVYTLEEIQVKASIVTCRKP